MKKTVKISTLKEGDTFIHKGVVQKELRKTGNEIRKDNYVTKINGSPKIV